MKKILLIAACSFLAFTSNAQSNTDEIALIQSAYGMEKKALIKQYMKLSSADSAGFWSAYDAYEVERKEIGKKRISVITDYAKNYMNLTDEKATELINTSLDNQLEFSKLMRSTFAKMSKTIGGKKAAQFIQIENYLENVIRLEIADEIPFVGEMEKSQKK